MASGSNNRKRSGRTARKIQQYQETRQAEMTARGETNSGSENASPPVRTQSARRGSPNSSTGTRSTRRKSPPTVPGLSSAKEREMKRNAPEKPGNVLDSIAVVPETPPTDSRAIGRKRIRFDSDASKGVRRVASEDHHGRQDLPIDDSVPCRSKSIKYVPGTPSLNAEESDFEELETPSKKRKSFLTPPRQQDYLQNLWDDENHAEDDNLEDDEDHAMEGYEPQREAMNTSQILRQRSEGLLPLGASREENRESSRIADDSQQLHARLQTESPALRMMFVDLRTQIMGALANQSKAQLAEGQNIRKDIAEIRIEMGELASVVQARAGSRSANLKSSKTALDLWEKKLDESLHHFGLVFTTDVFARVLGYKMTSGILQICEERTSLSLLSKASEAVSMLLFSLQLYQNRDLFATGIGALHCDFKCTVVKNCFYNVQMNSFGHFKEASSNNEDVENSERRPGDSKICQPVWLSHDYVRGANVMSARFFLEKKNQKKSTSIRETPSRSDIATQGSIRVYRALGAYLHNGREKVKSAFFQDLGYLLVNWSSFVPDIDQSKMTVEWAYVGTRNCDYPSLYEVPDTKKHRNPDSLTEIDATNKDALKKMYAEKQGMVLVAEHEVFVVSGKSVQRKHSGGTRRKIRRMIHIMEVAANFCVEYTQVKTIEAFLRSHTGALRCVFVIAVVFRALVESFMEKADVVMLEIPESPDIQGSICNLFQFMPGHGTMKSIICSRASRMNEREYETLNQIEELKANSPANGDWAEDEDIGAAIETSAAMGVAALRMI